MSPRKYSNNLAARMGRWSASHRKTAIFGWLAFVIAAVVLGMGAGVKQIDQSNSNAGQAHKADQILKQAGFKQSGPLTEIVVIQSQQRTIADPLPGSGVRRHPGGWAVTVHPRAPLTAGARQPRPSIP